MRAGGDGACDVAAWHGAEIGQQAASNLGEALAWNSLLCSLNLDKNDFGPEGGVLLAKAIDTRSLTNLSYARCPFVRALPCRAAV